LIDMVYPKDSSHKLYALTYDEVKIIDPAFALTEKEYEELKIE